MIENNGSVTLRRNTNQSFTKRERVFLQRALHINEKEHRPFSCLDFPNLTKGNFRQIIHGLKDQIVLHIKSRPCFYRLEGINLPGDTHKITQKVMGGEAIKLLQNLRAQPPTVHDLKLKFSSDFHSHLIKNGASAHPKNGSIKLSIPYFDKNVKIKLLVYPETVQIDIGCTYKPIIYDVSGVLELSSLLGRISQHIDYMANGAVYPSTNQWIITHYHFGKDGTEEYNGQLFHHTIEELGCGLIRLYSKQMPSGKTTLRVEQVTRLDNMLNKECETMIQSGLSSSCNSE